MELAIIALKQVITMFLIIFIGMLCFKIKIIDKKNNTALSAIVLNIVNPAVIFISYQKDFDTNLFKGLGYALILSAVSFVFAIVISTVLIRKNPKTQWNIERIAVIYSNCGFVGIPLINALIGSIGVFYLAAYLTCFNLLLWTHAVMLMKKLSGIEEVIKNFISPCVIAIFAGIIFFVLGIKLPESLYNAVDSIAGMNTPLAMIVAGVTIAQTNILNALKKSRVYVMCILKLILIPVVICFVVLPFYRMGIDKNIIMMVVIATACPTGASGTLFAIRYGGDSLYASELFGLTTFLSALTIPLVMMLAGYLYS